MRATIFWVIIGLCRAITLNGQSISIFTQDIRNHNLLASDSVLHYNYLPSISYLEGNYFKFLDAESGVSFNTKYPRSYNDGPLWQGKGLTYQLNGGFQIKKGYFYATFYPGFFHSQNRDFRLADIRSDRNEYNYQFGIFGDIDFTQRYGNQSFTKFYLGQTELAFRTDKLEVSVSTQNFSLGPARFNSIMMSNSGVGFPHLTIGSPKKIPVKISKWDLGSVDSQLFVGLLEESNFFDTISTNDLRYFNSLIFSYSFPKIESISIGFSKVMYKNSYFFKPSDFYSIFHNNDNGIVLNSLGDTILNSPNDSFDRMFSVFSEWRIKNQDMRIFFELVKNDFGGSWLLEDFEHSRAYSIGLEKNLPIGNRKLHTYFEHTLLIRSISYLYRANPAYYQHEAAPQGYTHKGQLIGAGIGPGSASDLLLLNFHKKDGYFGFSFERIRINEDYFIVALPNNDGKIRLHDAEYSIGGKYFKKTTYFNYFLNLSLNYRTSMYSINGNDKINIWGNMTVQIPLQKQKAPLFPQRGSQTNNL